MSKKHSTQQNDNAAGVISLAEVLSSPVKPSEETFFKPDLGENEDFVQDAVIEETEEAEYVEPQEVPRVTPEPASAERLTAKDISIIAVNFIDGLQRFGFGIISKKMHLTPEEMELVGGLDHSTKTIYPEGSAEALAMAKYRKHLETIKKLPFSDDEKKRLMTATEIYARTVDLNLTPLQGLVLAYGEVLTTRGINVFSDVV